MTFDEIEVQRMVADFMKASTPLETYLQQGGPLSPCNSIWLPQRCQPFRPFLVYGKEKIWGSDQVYMLRRPVQEFLFVVLSHFAGAVDKRLVTRTRLPRSLISTFCN